MDPSADGSGGDWCGGIVVNLWGGAFLPLLMQSFCVLQIFSLKVWIPKYSSLKFKGRWFPGVSGNVYNSQDCFEHSLECLFAVHTVIPSHGTPRIRGSASGIGCQPCKVHDLPNINNWGKPGPQCWGRWLGRECQCWFASPFIEFGWFCRATLQNKTSVTWLQQAYNAGAVLRSL